MLLGDPRQSDQRTQSFHFPIVIHQSLDPAAQSSAQAPSSLSLLYIVVYKLHAVRSSSTRQAQNASTRRSTRRRGNHMHDHARFQRDINDVTGVSLSLSLNYSQKSLTHNIGSAEALPIIIVILTTTTAPPPTIFTTYVDRGAAAAQTTITGAKKENSNKTWITTTTTTTKQQKQQQRKQQQQQQQQQQQKQQQQ